MNCGIFLKFSKKENCRIVHFCMEFFIISSKFIGNHRKNEREKIENKKAQKNGAFTRHLLFLLVNN